MNHIPSQHEHVTWVRGAVALFGMVSGEVLTLAGVAPPHDVLVPVMTARRPRSLKGEETDGEIFYAYLRDIEPTLSLSPERRAELERQRDALTDGYVYSEAKGWTREEAGS